MPRVILLIFAVVFYSNSLFAGSLQDNLKYLSHDNLEGRKPGQVGNELATKFLIQELQKYGVSPLAGSFEQSFTIFTEMQKYGKNFFRTYSRGPERDFQPISFSLSGETGKSDIVFGGYGISIPNNDPKIKYDDYAGLDIKDKIVIVMSGDPGVGNPNSPFRHPDYINYRSLFYKMKNAIAKGAKGILLVNDPLSLTGRVEEKPAFNSTEGGGNRFSILAGKVTIKFVNSLLDFQKGSLKNLQQQIAKTGKPVSYILKHKGNLAVHLKKKTGRVSNIVGVIEGTDPVLKKEVIVLGAHMDHLGYGGASSMEPNVHKIHNGADDNASGTALVLEFAKHLSKNPLKRTHVVALFNAEEMGLLGSAYFADLWARHSATYGPMKAMLNFDMVGRYESEVSVMGLDSSLNWGSITQNIQVQNFNFTLKKDAVASSDHASFLNKKIPSLFITTGAHEDYHTSHDTEEKINYTAIKAIQNYALVLMKNIDNAPKIDFNPNFSNGNGDGRNRGYGAHLGCIPKFGQSDDIKGVVCTGASEGSPAEKAGILAGDILVQIGDIDINSIYDLAFALKYYRAGDQINIAWKRGETLMKQAITLARSRRH